MKHLFFLSFFISSSLLGLDVMAADVVVIGSRESEVNLSGSGQFIDRDEIRRNSSGDVNAALRRNVPGVTLYEEDGYGLFPNISFRGVNSSRSGRITIMEDGILMAPAPYAAPAAYYSPFFQRMSGLEVLKGSSQVKYGPATTGGVLNYLSTPIPEESGVYGKVMYGSFKEVQTHTYAAYVTGPLSVLVEAATRETQGFKTIDNQEHNQFFNEETGHRIIDPSFKIRYDINQDSSHYLETGLGRFKMQANETYVGLTDEDFKKNPYRRYSGTRFDRIETEHDRLFLRHHFRLSTDSKVTTTAYYNRFFRDWYKLHRVNGRNPLANSDDYETLTGTGAGALTVRSNARSYESRGVDQKWSVGLGNHDLSFGVRFHRDRVKRFQRDDVYTQDVDGAVTDISRGVLGGAGDVNEKADALALYIQDEWLVTDRLILAPGARFERVNFKYLNHGGDNELKENTLSFINPALSARYELSDRTHFFSGVYKGSALPSPQGATRDENRLKDEKSYNFEIGVRRREASYSFESTFFYTQLRDLLALASVASGNESDSSIGKASSYGVEFKGAVDLGVMRDWNFSQRWYVNTTFAKAQIGGDYKNSGFLTGDKGNPLPYSPTYQLTIGATLEFERFGFETWGTYISEMYRTGEKLKEDKIDSQFQVNASAFAKLRPGARLLVQGSNLLNNEVMVSRTPYGARSGKPFALLAGLEFDLF